MANDDLGSWVRLDDNWLDNPKIHRAGVFGRALYLAGLLWSHRQDTDGDIPADMLDRLASDAGLTIVQAQEASSKLMEGPRPLWERTADGWRIHDYGTCQETSADREALRAQWRERQRRRRASSLPKPVASPPSEGPDDVTRDSPVTHACVHDPESESESDTKDPLSSSHARLDARLGARTRGTDDDDERISKAVDTVGDRKHRRELDAGRVRNPTKHRAACLANARTELAPKARTWLEANPDGTADQLIEHLDPPPKPTGRAKERPKTIDVIGPTRESRP